MQGTRGGGSAVAPRGSLRFAAIQVEVGQGAWGACGALDRVLAPRRIARGMGAVVAPHRSRVIGFGSGDRRQRYLLAAGFVGAR